MWQSFYSNGKLLITGEYAVLDGALALAIPTKFGQHLRARENETGMLRWTGKDEHNNIWFEQHYYLEDLRPVDDQAVDPSSADTSDRLISILKQAKKLNPQFLSECKGIELETKTDFNRSWGLGTSSTLINNIAQWSEVDAYELNRLTFGGSGYDIACAQSDSPLFYALHDGEPKVRMTEFKPPFASNLYFVYLNKKMDSREAILKYREAEFDREKFLHSITVKSLYISTCNDLNSFIAAMTVHEQLISEVLGISPVKDQLFPDYPGAVKSLGAWGGDFVLAASEKEGPEYFRSRGYETVIPFDEMIL